MKSLLVFHIVLKFEHFGIYFKRRELGKNFTLSSFPYTWWHVWCVVPMGVAASAYCINLNNAHGPLTGIPGTDPSVSLHVVLPISVWSFLGVDFNGSLLRVLNYRRCCLFDLALFSPVNRFSKFVVVILGERRMYYFKSKGMALKNEKLEPKTGD